MNEKIQELGSLINKHNAIVNNGLVLESFTPDNLSCLQIAVSEPGRPTQVLSFAEEDLHEYHRAILQTTHRLAKRSEKRIQEYVKESGLKE